MVTGPTVSGVGEMPEVAAAPAIPSTAPVAERPSERPSDRPGERPGHPSDRSTGSLPPLPTPPGADLHSRTLRRAQAALEVLFEHNPQPTLLASADGQVVQANFEARLRFGDHLGAALASLFGAADQERCRDALSFVGRYGRPASCSVVLAQSGQQLRARFAPGPGVASVMVSLADLTPVFDARRAAVQARDEMAALLDALPDPALVVAGGWVLWANRAMRALIPLEVGPEPKHPVLDLVHTADRAALAVLVPEDGGEPPTSAPLTVRLRAEAAPAGLPVEVCARAVVFSGLRCTLLAMRDLRARLRLENHLAQADRLATVGTLVAGVAHEVNNPLTFIVGNLDLLRDALQSGGRPLQAEEHLAMIDEAIEGARRVEAIVGELRTIHQVDDALGPVPVDELVARTLSLVRGRLGVRATLVHAPGGTPAEPLTARGNAGRLEQVILNLLLNAVQSMPPERGQASNRVWVRTWHTGAHPAPRADSDRSGLLGAGPMLPPHVCIEVADNGRGIAPADLPRLFEPFFTTRGAEGGTGLGLSVSANLVKRMGGWLEASSDAGGTRFVVHLPTLDGPLNGVTTVAPEAGGVAGERGQVANPIRILLVDDEPGITSVIARALRDLGTCDVATSGREAIALLAAAGRPDAQGAPRPEYAVVLCDWLMADGNGRDVHTWLAGRRPDLLPRLIYITGAVPPAESLARAHSVVKKPISLAELRAVVAGVVAGVAAGVAAGLPSDQPAASAGRT